MTGIYKITNTKNNKVYIGQSLEILSRWKNHLKIYNNENYALYNRSLYKDMRKYGIENFQFSIVELCTKEELSNKEKYWINFYNSFESGYNDSDYSNCYSKLNQEQAIEIINHLKNTKLKIYEIAKLYNVSSAAISDINLGRTWTDKTISYPIRERTKKQSEKTNKCVLCGELINDNSTYCVKCGHKKLQRCERPSREELKNLIRTKSFCEIGRIFGVTDNAIRKWCDSYSLPRRVLEIKQISDEEWKKI